MEPHAPQAPAVIARPPRPTNDVFLVWAPRRCSRPTGPPTARRIQRALVPCLAPPVVCTWCQIVYIEALGPPPGPDHRPSSASPTCVWCIIILASSSRLYHHITCPPPFPCTAAPFSSFFNKPCRDTINSHLVLSFGSSALPRGTSLLRPMHAPGGVSQSVAV